MKRAASIAQVLMRKQGLVSEHLEEDPEQSRRPKALMNTVET